MNGTVLIHHGILGMHWGIRRFQNPDGSLTAAGRARYYQDAEGNTKRLPSGKELKNERANLAVEYVESSPHARAVEDRRWELVKEQMAEENALAKKVLPPGYKPPEGKDGLKLNDLTAEQRQQLLDKLRENMQRREAEAQRLSYELDSAGREYADKVLLKKYGSQAFEAIENDDNKQAKKMVAAMAAIPLAAVAAGLVTRAIRKKKEG